MKSPEEFYKQEKRRQDENKEANKPIVMLTYVFSGVFLLLIVFIAKFMIADSETVIANSYNKRQDAMATKVIRGDIRTIDGEVLATNSYDESGDYTRVYPKGNLFAHAVGFSTKGKSGMELTHNYYLLNSNSNIFKRAANTMREEKNMGDTVVSTLNYQLQETSYQAMGSAKGAVIVMEPDTGKILTMLSKPDFDPNQIDAIWDSIVAEDQAGNSVLLNRATQGLYPPGSTFKVITALEYMRENPGYASYSYDCQGEGIYNSVAIHCYNNRVHGTVSLADSLAYSCNTSFANLGSNLSKSGLQTLAKELLFNQALPYNGVSNPSRFVITEQSDQNQLPQTVIGQGDTLMTPLHNAMIMSAIANGGILMKPYMVDHIENSDGGIVKKISPDSYKRILPAAEVSRIIPMLEGVVSYGTGTALQTDRYTVAGKTGTAEYNEAKNSHSWFVGFSNIENPDIVVCVIVEDNDTVGLSAVTVAKQIFDRYYEIQGQ